MNFKMLSERDQSIILQCMTIVLEGGLLDEAEFQTRLGIDKQELSEVIALGPHLDDSDVHSDTFLAINNCLVEVCYGINIDNDKLIKLYNTSRQDIEQAFKRWKNDH